MDSQLGKRNLSPVQKITVAKKYEDSIRKQAKEKQGTRNDLTSSPDGEKVETKIHTDREISKIADVGTGTLRKTSDIKQSAYSKFGRSEKQKTIPYK